MKKTLLSFLLLWALAGNIFAAPAGNAPSVLNSFIATFAKDNPAWKGDIVAITDPTNVPPGRQLGYSAVLGYYTFLPKTWNQLTDAERNDVYSDSRLKPFLVSLRNYNNYPALTSTDTPKPAFAVYPVEGMMAPQSPYYYPNAYPAYPMVAPGYPAGYPMPAPQMNYFPAAPQPMPMGYPVAPGYSTPTYTAPAGYYYTPQQLSPRPALVQPITVVAPQQPQMSKLKVSAEEMLLDRPLRVYMQDRR